MQCTFQRLQIISSLILLLCAQLRRTKLAYSQARSLGRLAVTLVSVALLTSCAKTVDNKIIEGLATAANVQERVDEPTIRKLFGISDVTYTRKASSDEYGSYGYSAVGEQPLLDVGVDNLPHYNGGGAGQQKISVRLPEGTCITPEMVRRQTGRSYGPDVRIFPPEVSFASRSGGAFFRFSHGNLIMYLRADCARQIIVE